ncbi:MAG: hypothetical protein NC452_16985 [Eubacterium sp.]|nr:hypothetical protein [Eubacterium sp.]
MTREKIIYVCILIFSVIGILSALTIPITKIAEKTNKTIPKNLFGKSIWQPRRIKIVRSIAIIVCTIAMACLFICWWIILYH